MSGSTCFCGCGRSIPRTPLGVRSVNKRGGLVAERQAWLGAFSTEHPRLLVQANEPNIVSTLLRDGDLILADLRRGLHGPREGLASLDEAPSGHWLKASRVLEGTARQYGFPSITDWLNLPGSRAAVGQVAAGTSNREPQAQPGRSTASEPQPGSPQAPPEPSDFVNAPPEKPTVPSEVQMTDESPYESREHEAAAGQVAGWLNESFGRVNVRQVDSGGPIYFVTTPTGETPAVLILMGGDEPVIDINNSIWFETEGIDIKDPRIESVLAIAALRRNTERRFTKWGLEDDALTLEASISYRRATRDEVEFLVQVVAAEMLDFYRVVKEIVGE